MNELATIIGVYNSEMYGNEFGLKCYWIMLHTRYIVWDEVYAFTLLTNCVGW